VLVPFPFTDLTGSKQRPALVISPNRLNAIRDDVVLIAITSQIPAALGEDEVLVAAADLTGTGLLKPSVIRLAKIMAIHQDLVRRKIGGLSPTLLQRVQLQWQHLFNA
jgi:mRNA interferase MazF